MECWSIVFLCTLWLQLYRKTKCACRVTAPALQLCATVTNTLLMCWLCYHTPHFCILVKPTHCSQVYPFSHTRRELSLTQNSVRALALEDTWAVQWKVDFSRVTRCAELFPVLLRLPAPTSWCRSATCTHARCL